MLRRRGSTSQPRLTKPKPRAPPARPNAGTQAAVERKRAHRQALALQATAHWDELGERRRKAYLFAVRRALVKEGFRATPLQWRHKGHAYGLVKDLGDRQVHVRVYDNGVIDAEVEIHRRYIEHLWSPRPSAHKTVLRILRKHGIPATFVNEQYLPAVGAMRKRFPERRTHVARVAGAAVAVVGPLVAASLARMLLGRRVR